MGDRNIEKIIDHFNHVQDHRGVGLNLANEVNLAEVLQIEFKQLHGVLKVLIKQPKYVDQKRKQGDKVSGHLEQFERQRIYDDV